MQRSNASEISKEVILSLKSVIGNGVKHIALHDVVDDPFQAFNITYTIYDYFNMRFNFEKGHFGTCIVNGEQSISIKTTEEWIDNCNFDEYWKEVAEIVKLRIPDKFLERYEWE